MPTESHRSFCVPVAYLNEMLQVVMSMFENSCGATEKIWMSKIHKEKWQKTCKRNAARFTREDEGMLGWTWYSLHSPRTGTSPETLARRARSTSWWQSLWGEESIHTKTMLTQSEMCRWRETLTASWPRCCGPWWFPACSSHCETHTQHEVEHHRVPTSEGGQANCFYNTHYMWLVSSARMVGTM